MFLKFPWFFNDPTDVSDLISGSSAFSKSSLHIWKFSIYTLLKPSLKDFEHYLASKWNVCNCMLGTGNFCCAEMKAYLREACFIVHPAFFSLNFLFFFPSSISSFLLFFLNTLRGLANGSCRQGWIGEKGGDSRVFPCLSALSGVSIRDCVFSMSPP